MGGEAQVGAMLGGGSEATLCGFGGCSQVWNHKGRCEVPILSSRRASRGPARLDDAPFERHPREEKADGHRSSPAPHQWTNEDWACAHETVPPTSSTLQSGVEQTPAVSDPRPETPPAPEQGPAAVDARPDTPPAPEQAPVSSDAVLDSHPAPEQTPAPRPASDAPSGRGEKRGRDEETPVPPDLMARSNDIVTEVRRTAHRMARRTARFCRPPQPGAPPTVATLHYTTLTVHCCGQVDGLQLYLSRQSSTGYRGVVDCSRPGQERDRPFKAQATAPQVRRPPPQLQPHATEAAAACGGGCSRM